MTNMTAAERVKMVREMFHLKTTQMADALGVSGSIISCMERGKANISRKMAMRMLEVFSISPAWLQYGAGEMFMESDDSVDTILEGNSDLKKIYDAWVEKDHAVIIKAEQRLEKIRQMELRRKNAAERMKQFRKAYQINQNQLAKRLGYTRAYISAVEKGIQTPSLKMAQMIESEFGVSATWLLYGNAA